VASWLANSRGDIGRVSIRFFHGTVVIEVCNWIEDYGQFFPGKVAHFALRVRDLPTFADAIARAVSFGRECGSFLRPATTGLQKPPSKA
jgi:hypothetical protein